MLEYLVACVIVFTVTIVCYFKWTYAYWKRRNVAYIEPTIPLGNLENPLSLKKGFIGMLADAYKEFRFQGKKYGGFFLMHKPVLMPVDPDLIKLIMTKDFQHFMNHGNFIDEKNEPLSANLLNLEDEKWKNLRTKLSPTFTSGKMKVMHNEMISCGQQMVEHIDDLCSERTPMDVKETVSCYSTDIIGSCAFGVDCNSFKNPNEGFRKYGRLVTDLSPAAALRMFLIFILPEVKQFLGLKMFRKDAEEFFTNAFKDVMHNRLHNNAKRNDFIQILLELGQGHGDASKGLTMEEMLAQSFIFFGAGFETSATNLAFCLYELALNQDIQEKIRDEVQSVLRNHYGELSYEAVMDMKYMDQVLDESLRKYPPIPFINRKCSKRYDVPGSDLVIEKGTSVMLSTLGLQMDPEYFPDPEKFDPERFSKENKAARHPFVYLPFGDGPRICIGQRFAILQNKIGLAVILKNFKLLPHSSTPKRVQINPRAITMASTIPILLNCQRV